MTKKVPLAIDPIYVDRLQARDPATREIVPDELFRAMSAALSAAHESAAKIIAAADAVSADKTQTPEANAVRIRQTALTLAGKAADKLDTVRKRALEELQVIREQTYAPPPPKDELAARFEEKALDRLAGMPKRDRDKIISDALKNDDAIVLGAVFRAPAWLVGMTDAEQEMKRHSTLR